MWNDLVEFSKLSCFFKQDMTGIRLAGENSF